MKRLPVLVLGGVSAAAMTCAFVQPINSTLLRLLALGAAGTFFGTALVLCWRPKPLRWALLACLALAALPLLLPGRPPDVERLRQAYAQALTGYAGVGYVWGGEGRMGIDCSGLPRRALRDALVSEGLRTLNGGLIREAATQWWHDASAKTLARGYRGYLTPLFVTKALRTADFSTLKPGDVAITPSGIHCLVYLDGDMWIQADPDVGKVAEYDARSTTSGWFSDPVKLYRWRILE